MSGDVVVIGGDPSGLIAATYLAKAGAHVVVLEAAPMPGGSCANRVPVGDFAVPAGPHVFTAIDPVVVKELKLSRTLRFAERDLPLVGLRSDAKPLRLGRDVHESHRAIAPASSHDAERFETFHHDLFAFGRAMRSLWWNDGALKRIDDRSMLRRLAVTSAGFWVESAFESEALRAAFAFDALAAGLSPAAAGSALVLAWQAAQEMCGLQGAAAIPFGGPAVLVEALVNAAQAAGVDIRCGSEVVRLGVEGEAVTGALLASGEIVSGRAVLSSLSRRTTLLRFLPPGAIGFAAARLIEKPCAVGEGKLVLALNAIPFAFRQPGRFVIAERLEGAAAAHGEACAGKLPTDLVLEAVILETGGDPSALLSVKIRPLPVMPGEDWKPFSTRVVQSVLRILERHAPDLTGQIGALALVPPQSSDPYCPSHMMLDWRERITSPMKGLFLCGEAAEPVPVLSGRAARIAAAMAVAHLKESRP